MSSGLQVRPKRVLALVSAAAVVVGLAAPAAAAAPARPVDGPTEPAEIESYLENPRRTGEGQEPQHALLRPYANAADALRGAREDTAAPADAPTPWTLPLDGGWKFHYADHHRDLPENWQRTGTGDWSEVSVPGVWQQQGHDRPIYRNVPMDLWPYDPPKVPDDLNPTGAYVRDVELPENWDGRRQLLRFEGATSGWFVWVNGRYVGYDQGGYTPAEFDVTRYLRPGHNRIAVQVHRWGSGAYLEDMDFWRLSGIFRGVHLYSVPRTHLEDVTVRTELDDSYTSATVRLGVDLRRVDGGSTGAHTVRASLYDPEGERVRRFSRPVPVDGGGASTELVRRIHDPRLWSDETPALYTVVLELLGPDGRVVHTTQQPVGFREVEVRGKRILLNGEPVDLRGVNRHEHDPDTGRTVGRETQRTDVELMLRHNINAVRTSHYPNDPFFYRLADRRGLLLADEVDIETHYREDCSAEGDQDCLADRPEWQKAFADRFAAMLERDKNHPSVIMWDTGNEAGLGEAHHRMAEHADAVDPTRLLYHQSNSPDGNAPYADVWGPRYPSPEHLREIARRTTKPVVLGEWLHAMGNSLGHYEDMWEIIRREPALQGGFVWDWVDQGLRRPLRTTPDSSGNDIPVQYGGDPTPVPGVSGRGLALSGLDDWVQAYRAPELDIAGREVALDIRVKPLSWAGSNTFLAKGNRQWSLRMPDSGHVEFQVYGDDGAEHTATVPVPEDWWGRWHRLTGTYDGTHVRLFLDGAQVAATPFDGEIAQDTMHTMTIGRDQATHGDGFAGRTAHAVVDSARVYDHALEPARIAADPSEEAALALDFDTERRRGTYLDYGASPFVVNGLVNADRTPQPELAQLAYSHAPIRFDPAGEDGSAADGRVVVRDLGHTLSTADYEMDWRLIEGGEEIASGPIDVEVAPGRSREIALDLPPEGEVERFLVLRARRNGHPVASEQLRAGGERPPEPPVSGGESESLRVSDTDQRVVVRGSDFAYTFDRSAGTLSAMAADGRQRLVGGPRLDVFRPPVGNEWSDWSGLEPEAAFRSVGLDRLRTEVDSFVVDRPSPEQVRITVRTRSVGVGDNGFRNRWVYTVDGTGAVRLDHEVRPYGEAMRGLPWLPRVGFSMRVPESAGRLDWYGRGPGESYPDREDAQHIGRWSRPVEWFGFLPPQDNGVKGDTSWAVLSGPGGGVQVSGEPMFVSADRYSNAERTDFGHQLRRDPFVTLHVSAEVTGLGDTPVATLPKYRVPADRSHSYSVVLRPTE